MTIIDFNPITLNVEGKFDNGAWCSITKNGNIGSFEYQISNDEDTYIEGCLLFDNNNCIDFDGCFSLPNEVISLLLFYNIKIL